MSDVKKWFSIPIPVAATIFVALLFALYINMTGSPEGSSVKYAEGGFITIETAAGDFAEGEKKTAEKIPYTGMKVELEEKLLKFSWPAIKGAGEYYIEIIDPGGEQTLPPISTGQKLSYLLRPDRIGFNKTYSWNISYKITDDTTARAEAEFTLDR